jgi:hypothetical protein
MFSASVLTFLPAGASPTSNAFGLPVKLLLSFDSKIIPGFTFLEIHDQDFYSLLE